MDRESLATELLKLAGTIERSPTLMTRNGLCLRPVVPVEALDALKDAAAVLTGAERRR